MTRTTQEFFERVKAHAKTVFEAEGHHVQAFVSDIGFIPTPWGSNQEKHLMVSAVRSIFKEHDATLFAFIFECWIASERMPADRKSFDASTVVPPSERPDRQEAVMIIVQEKGGEQFGGFWRVSRDGGKPHVTKFENMPKGSLETFTFDNMFSEKRTVQ